LSPFCEVWLGRSLPPPGLSGCVSFPSSYVSDHIVPQVKNTNSQSVVCKCDSWPSVTSAAHQTCLPPCYPVICDSTTYRIVLRPRMHFLPWRFLFDLEPSSTTDTVYCTVHTVRGTVALPRPGATRPSFRARETASKSPQQQTRTAPPTPHR
jgi:hypothetical protein